MLAPEPRAHFIRSMPPNERHMLAMDPLPPSTSGAYKSCSRIPPSGTSVAFSSGGD